MTIRTTITGIPRIGPDRELKRVLERYWRGEASSEELATTARELNHDYLSQAREAGIHSVPVAGRSFYDTMLDTTALLGVLPQRFADVADHTDSDLPAWVDRSFATARGTKELPASAMTKWFDTNYHYIVPELSESTEFTPNLTTWLSDLAEQRDRLGVDVRPSLVGPLTYLKLARATDGSTPLDLLERLFDTYIGILEALEGLGVAWVQIDEPALVTDLPDDLLRRVHNGYGELARRSNLSLLVQTYFGDGDQALATLADTEVKAIGVDLVAGGSELAHWNTEQTLVAGIVDGRNVWRTDVEAALATLRGLAQRGPIEVSTSCSLLHVPYTLDREDESIDQVRPWLAFGYEKLAEVTLLARLLEAELEGTEPSAEDQQTLKDAKAAQHDRETSDLTRDAALRERLSKVTDEDRTRESIEERREAQQESLQLPPLPTTTIGSFPQTQAIRSARAKLKRGELTPAEYEEAMKAEIRDVIERQEALGLDVLVHGEPERNDMVQYFSEQLNGYLSTHYGWVQSYGSRCVRPPILFGDVTRPHPMTTEWFRYAQSLTDKPVKGMLTGPVTMLAWSFVRDDQPLGETADQVALALRDEITDLVDAGAKIIQVDEPAIRELLPLRQADQPAYLKWSVGSFRLATSGVSKDVQIHTHMCYSEFNELIATIGELNADVTSIESARNGMQVLAALKANGYELGIGPGVWDIHSPRVPGQQEVDELLADALRSVDPRLLWVNPDCGLKTRGWEETTASLKVLVHAANQAREGLKV